MLGQIRVERKANQTPTDHACDRRGRPQASEAPRSSALVERLIMDRASDPVGSQMTTELVTTLLGARQNVEEVTIGLAAVWDDWECKGGRTSEISQCAQIPV